MHSDYIGIMVNDHPNLLVGLLGILKAGHCFVPLSPAFPNQRIEYIITDCNIRLILTDDRNYERIKKLAQARPRVTEVINLDHPPGVAENPGISPQPGPPGSPLQPCYVIYTSGSTGKPKGVAITHRNIAPLLLWSRDYFKLDRHIKALQTLSYTFDFGIMEIFTTILFGGTLFFLDKNELNSLVEYVDFINGHSINTIHTTPAFFSNIVSLNLQMPSLKILHFGGERLNGQLIDGVSRLTGQTCAIYNGYGPTETTINCSIFSIRREGPTINYNLPIGQPSANNILHILDPRQNPSPIGVPGELFISGGGLATGYLNQPDLSAAKFIENPFLPGQRMYCSGDSGRWLPDGNIEFLGRIDLQVKIRGFRVELGEIETQLLEHPGIREAVVLLKGHSKAGSPGEVNEDQYLCAYLVVGQDLDIPVLRDHLAGKLPEYMIPAYFVKLDKLPLTANGKVDRKALPEPQGIALEREIQYRDPRNPLEKKLAETWQKVLGRKLIGINENFFMIGGDSIKAIQVVSRMYKAGYRLKVIDIFQYPEISLLAPVVEKIEREADQSVITGPVPLTPIQREFFREPLTQRHHYNQAVMLYHREALDPAGVKAVFGKIQQHHDALRMTFKEKEGEIVQFNHGLDYPLSFEEYDYRHYATGQDAVAALETRAQELQGGIDLEQGPLMKLALFHLEDGDRLLIVIHHLVIDGVSWRILFEDIDTLYRQYKNGDPLVLPAKTDSFRTWAEQLLPYSASQAFLKEKAYWARVEAAAVPPINKDYNGDNRIINSGTLSANLNPEETTLLLTKVNRAFGTTIVEILLTALGLASKRYQDQDRLLIALEGHGREDILEDVEVSRTVGWFTSVFPVMLDLSYADDLSRQLKEVKESLRQIPHRGIGYGILKHLTPVVDKKEIDFKLNPRWSVNYLGQFDTDVEQTAFGIAREACGDFQSSQSERRYELDVSGLVRGGQLTLSITYSKEQYKQETVRGLLEHFRAALQEIITYCSLRREPELTPGDLTYSSLSIDTLDRLSKGYALADIYPLTPMQEGMLFQSLYDRSSTAYFEQMSYRLRGELDLPLIKKSVSELCKRYDVLRTVFIHEDLERPLQLILKERDAEVTCQDLTGRETAAEKEDWISAYKEKDRQRSFDLSRDALMRIAVIRVEEAEYEFTWSFHHILMDGWCTGILISDFFTIYYSHLRHREPKLPPVKPYRNYIQWLEQQDKNRAKQYWTGYLENYRARCGIPEMKPLDRAGQDHRHVNEHYILELDETATSGLKRLAGLNHITLNTLIQTLWGILLGHYNTCEDVVFGAVVSGRPPEIEGVESMVGLFINTIPVRIRWDETTGFARLLRDVQEEAIDSKPHHYYPLGEIQASHPLKQDLLDHVVVFENYPLAEQLDGIMTANPAGGEEIAPLGGMALKLSKVETFEQINYPFGLIIVPGNRLRITFDYHVEVYERGLIQRIAAHFNRLFKQILENPGRRIGQLEGVGEEAREELLFTFNETAVEFPAEQTIQDLLAEQLDKSTHQIALVFGPKQLSYGELNRQAQQTSLILKTKGIKPGDLVALAVQRSLEMIVTLLGILKSGAAYLPLDPGYPLTRLRYMLTDSACGIVITDENAADAVMQQRFSGSATNPAHFVKIHDIVIGNSARGNGMEEETATGCSAASTTPSRCSSRELAYVIYTSGTTGVPKGAALEHRGVVNMLRCRKANYQLTHRDVCLQLFSYAFDGFVTSLFTPLASGSRVILLQESDVNDITGIKTALVRHRVTHFITVPSLYRALLEIAAAGELRRLKLVTLAGDKISPRLLEISREKNRDLEIAIEYGVTEASVMSTLSRQQHQENPARHPAKIGKPVWNTRLYIVNRKNRLLPVGAAGELCISGVGLSRGYLNNPALTSEKFTANPFAKGERWYRSGDLCRWFPDANVEFLGRIDHQVKIRGFRIELEEIQQQLLSHESIRASAVVTAVDNEGSPYLEAYVVSDSPVTGTELRNHLLTKLPLYMIPAHFHGLGKMPLTPNGKLDRKALPSSSTTLSRGAEYIAPSNDMEKVIAGIWREILQVEEVGIHDNYFDLGGNSYNIIRTAARLKSALGKEIEIVTLFEYPTLRSLYHYLNGDGAEKQQVNEKSDETRLNKIEDSLQDAVDLFDTFREVK